MIGGQLFLFHVMQPSDCACPERQIAALPANLPQQPENLPEVPPLLLERDSAGSSSTVISAIGNDGVMGSDFSVS
jgi:hypothetical protein